MHSEEQKIYDELYSVGKEYAKAKANYSMLSESKKSVLAKEASQHEWSEATKTRIALTSKIYKEYLLSVQVAEQQTLELKYKLDSLNMKFEFWRSMNSVNKKSMNIL